MFWYNIVSWRRRIWLRLSILGLSLFFIQADGYSIYVEHFKTFRSKQSNHIIAQLNFNRGAQSNFLPLTWKSIEKWTLPKRTFQSNSLHTKRKPFYQSFTAHVGNMCERNKKGERREVCVVEPLVSFLLHFVLKQFDRTNSTWFDLKLLQYPVHSFININDELKFCSLVQTLSRMLLAFAHKHHNTTGWSI